VRSHPATRPDWPRLRVLFVAHSYPRRDGDLAGNFLLRLARALREHAGVEPYVLAPSAPGLDRFDTIGGVRVERVRYAPRAWETLAYEGTMADAVRDSWRARAALLGMLGATWAQTRLSAHRHADLVHAHWWFPGALAATLPGGTYGRPVVCTMHGSDVRLAVKSGPARALFARVARRCDAMTAVSSWLCAQAADMAPGLRCEVAPMPVEADLFTPAPAGQPRSRLLFVGRLTRQKGVDALFRAMARMRHPARLVIMGEGPERPALVALADALGIAERVEWRGQVSQRELATMYRMARALVVPSTGEGLGLVAVEAHLSGTPVVAFDSGGLPDVVRDGVDGLLVPPGDEEALAAALDRVLDDPHEADRLGAAGRADALARFTPRAVALRYLDLYERVMAARGRPPLPPARTRYTAGDGLAPGPSLDRRAHASTGEDPP
jgi:glycosyltransferase involved in cell wall biosynthesis